MSLSRLLRALLVILVVAATGAIAHVRLINPSNGAALYWGDPSNISVTFNAAGPDSPTDGSHLTALRNAVDSWNSVEGTRTRLVLSNSAAAQARTDWESNSIHMMLFDEFNSSGYFPNGSGTVAITPVWFFSGGRIVDADVLFNGKGFAFTTSGQSARYDIQDVAVHELGHLIGLDHSGWAGSSMYPYVDPSVLLHRSLSQDEHTALRRMYPEGANAQLRGTIRRASNNSAVRGSHVVARDSSGRPVGAALSSSTGVFSIGVPGLDSYTLYATPLDFPVSGFNLGSGWVIDTDFESTQFGNVTLGAGEDHLIGDVLVGGDVSLSLGRNSDPYPLRCRAGETTNISIRGSGLSSGSVLTASDPTLVVTALNWLGNRVTATVTVPPGSPNGHSDVMVVNSFGDRSILVAGLEITPPNPTVTLISPNQGDYEGGSIVTIFGSNFEPGARVVMGGEIYEDGVDGGCTVANNSTITLTTRSGTLGTTDVVVIDDSGVEGRKVGGFDFFAVPVVNTLFPASGSKLGGTELHIVGKNFDFQTTVRINGVSQGTVLPVSSKELVVLTEASAVSGLFIVDIENAGGSTATSQFTYTLRPDPVVSSVSPSSGMAAGGELITIEGAQFSSNVRVVFGADPSTGLGGSEVAQVTVIDSNTIEVVNPAGSGAVSVIVEDMGTGQASVASSSFTYNHEDGGGGGCYTVPVSGPPDWGQMTRGLLWLMLMAIGVRAVGRVNRPLPVS